MGCPAFPSGPHAALVGYTRRPKRFYERTMSVVRIDWTKERRKRFVAVLVLLTGLATAACMVEPAPGPLDRLHPCKTDEGPTDAYCGTLSVFENRDTKRGRQIALFITVLPAIRPQSPDPLFF